MLAWFWRGDEPNFSHSGEGKEHPSGDDADADADADDDADDDGNDDDDDDDDDDPRWCMTTPPWRNLRCW